MSYPRARPGLMTFTVCGLDCRACTDGTIRQQCLTLLLMGDLFQKGSLQHQPCRPQCGEASVRRFAQHGCCISQHHGTHVTFTSRASQAHPCIEWAAWVHSDFGRQGFLLDIYMWCVHASRARADVLCRSLKFGRCLTLPRSLPMQRTPGAPSSNPQ